MSVRILVGTIVAMALLLNGCGQSQDEKKKIAAVTCAIMVESRNMDASIRVEKINEARDKIGGEPFLDGDDAIKEAFEYGLCQELVLNETYDQILQSLEEAARERELKAAEKQRIADSKPTVKEEFWPNGKLKSRENFQSVADGGRRHGLSERYHENGQLEAKLNYKDGKVVDELSESYHPNGQLRKKENYKDGKENGLYEEYNPNGQLFIKANYKDGKLHGLLEFYDENGQLRKKENYKDGEYHGIRKTYREDGQEYMFSPQCFQNDEEVDMSNCEKP